MPHKRVMIPLVDELDEGARISGAVNTVVIEASKTRGYNTDGGGMVMACAEAGIELSGKNVLLRSEEHTSELQSPCNLVCRLLLPLARPPLPPFPTRRSSDLDASQAGDDPARRRAG